MHSELTLSAEPQGATAIERARSVLRPFGLTLTRLSGDLYRVEKAARASPSQPVPGQDASRPMNGAHAETISIVGVRFESETSATQSVSIPAAIELPGSQDDALRATRILPSLSTLPFAPPRIRGGRMTATQIRFDGIPLIEPYHFRGFQNLLSAFDPGVIQRIEVHAGGFPVAFGNAGSSVIDIVPRETHANSATIGASLLTSRALSVGRMPSQPLEWLVSLRRSTLDVTLDALNSDVGAPVAADSLGRVRWTAQNGARTTVGWLALNDRVKLNLEKGTERAQERFHDATLWVSREQWVGDDHLLTTRFSSRSNEQRRTGSLDRAGLGAGVLVDDQATRDVRLSQDLLSALGRWQFSSGWEALQSKVVRDFSIAGVQQGALATAFARSGRYASELNDARRTRYFGAYTSASWQLAHSVSAEAGLRYDFEGSSAPSFHDAAVSPRLSVRADLSPTVQLHGSWGAYSQAIHLSFWRLEDSQAQADPMPRQDQRAMGIRWSGAATTLSLEGYSYRSARVVPYYENLLNPLSLLPELEPDRVRIAPEAETTQGIELAVQHRMSARSQIRANYSFSSAREQVDGRWQPSAWDQRHSASLAGQWSRGPWSVSSALAIHSGWPRTPIEIAPAGSIVVGERNSARWRVYSSFDMRVSWRRAGFTAWTELTNAFDRRNSCCFSLEPTQSALPRADMDAWAPRLLNVGFDWSVP